jgi:Tol biopolymer transport system component
MKRIVLALTTLIVLAAGAPRAQEADKLFKAAMNTEMVDGNLAAAIEQYKQVVKTGTRALAAQALVRMAECYQKLGDAQAMVIFERVLTDYADQKEAVASARAHLRRGDGAVARSGMASRLVLTLPPVADLGSVSISRDGRFLTYTDWERNGDLFLYEFGTARERRLSDRTQPSDYAETSAISRDGKRVVYAWCCPNRYELRLAPVDGTAPQSRVLYANDDVVWIQPFDWSPDGKWIAVQLERRDRTRQLGLISSENGSLRVLKSSEWRGASQLSFSPDGRYVGFDASAGETTQEQRDVFILAVDGSREVAVVVNPSDDTMMGWSPDGKHLLFASDRSGTVALWALPIAVDRPQGAPELIKTDVPRRSVGVTASGSLYLGAFLGGRDIHIASVDFATGRLASAPFKPIQSFHGLNDSPVWSPDGKLLAYHSRRNISGSNPVLGIWAAESDRLRELRPKLNYFQQPSWAPDGRSLIVSGRDLKDRRGAYRIDLQTGEATPVGENAGVRPQLSPDGKKLHSRNRGTDMAVTTIAEWDLDAGREKAIIRRDNLGPPSLSPDGQIIAAVFNDKSTQSTAVMLIPVSGGEPRELWRVAEPESLDLRWVAWMPDGSGVIVSKSSQPATGDGGGHLWHIPMTGGKPRNIDLGTPVWSGFRFQIHPDGRQIAFVAGQNKQEIWVLENFLPAMGGKN